MEHNKYSGLTEKIRAASPHADYARICGALNDVYHLADTVAACESACLELDQQDTDAGFVKSNAIFRNGSSHLKGVYLLSAIFFGVTIDELPAAATTESNWYDVKSGH